MRDFAFLLWPFVAAYAIWRFAPVAERFAPRGEGVKPDDVAIPDDLIGLALRESETWAQDEVMQAIRERYTEHKDWNKVRIAMGVAVTP